MHRKVPLALIPMFLVLGGLAIAGTAVSRPPQPTAIDVYFSPKGGCQDAIIREVDAAKESVHVQAYSFTSAPIAAAACPTGRTAFARSG